VTGTTNASLVTFNQGIPIVPHVHGGHTQAAFDGTPLQWFTPTGLGGSDYLGTNTFAYDNSQQAGTIWYHDHADGITRLNVEAGLAGFYIIHDTNENTLITNHNLPDETHDIPLAIQDRMFTAPGYVTPNDPTGLGGQLYYPSDVLAGTTVTYPNEHPEFFGDTILVNGQAWPVLNVDPRMYRFRVLDGSNARFYDLKLIGQTTGTFEPFFQIGTDDGLLPAPVPLTSLLVAPGERADIVVDFSALAGKTIIVTNGAKAPYPKGTPVDPKTTGLVMAFKVSNTTPIHDVTLPASLNNPALNLTPTKVEQKGLFEFTDSSGRLIQYLGTPQTGFSAFLPSSPSHDPHANADTITLAPDVTSPSGFSATVQWQVFNTTADVHPIHLHQVSFQIVSRQSFNAKVNPVTGVFTPKLTGQPSAPAANEAGWKDTVQMYPGTVTTINAKFDLTGLYVWHCHILEHEEHDMMHFLNVVKPNPGSPAIVAAPSTTSTASTTVSSSPIGADPTVTGQLTATGQSSIDASVGGSLLVSDLTAVPSQTLAPTVPVNSGLVLMPPPALIDPSRVRWDDIMATDLLGAFRHSQADEGVLDQVFADYTLKPVDDLLGDLPLV
jgi:spore coat protein A, manganese oxidase